MPIKTENENSKKRLNTFNELDKNIYIDEIKIEKKI